MKTCFKVSVKEMFITTNTRFSSTHTCTQARTCTCAHMHTHTHTLTHSLSLTRTHKHACTHIHSLTLSLSHTHTHTHKTSSMPMPYQLPEHPLTFRMLEAFALATWSSPFICTFRSSLSSLISSWSNSSKMSSRVIIPISSCTWGDNQFASQITSEHNVKAELSCTFPSSPTETLSGLIQM